MTLNIVLNNVGKKAWLGGVQYLHNLIRALHTLPTAEQPRLMLLFQGWETDTSLYAEVADMVTQVFAYTAEAASPWSALRQRTKQFFLGRPYLTYPQAFARYQADVFFPVVQKPDYSLTVKWVAWAWDLQHKYYPDFFSAADIARRDDIFSFMAQEARLIVTSSQNAADDFARYYPGTRSRLRVLNFATSPLPAWYTDSMAAVQQKYHLPPKFLALPNTFWIHKNHRLAFEAVQHLVAKHKEVYVVCTGGLHDARRPDYFGELQQFIATHHLENHIRILGVLPREDQLQVLRASTAILQPSLFEGWSTVVEDARALGKPLILSDIPVHREQNPPRTIFFDPHQVESLVSAIESIWDELLPGPTLEIEVEAHLAQTAHIQSFAKRFIEIASE